MPSFGLGALTHAGAGLMKGTLGGMQMRQDLEDRALDRRFKQRQLQMDYELGMARIDELRNRQRGGTKPQSFEDIYDTKNIMSGVTEALKGGAFDLAGKFAELYFKKHGVDVGTIKIVPQSENRYKFQSQKLGEGIEDLIIFDTYSGQPIEIDNRPKYKWKAPSGKTHKGLRLSEMLALDQMAISKQTALDKAKSDQLTAQAKMAEASRFMTGKPGEVPIDPMTGALGTAIPHSPETIGLGEKASAEAGRLRMGTEALGTGRQTGDILPKDAAQLAYGYGAFAPESQKSVAEAERESLITEEERSLIAEIRVNPDLTPDEKFTRIMQIIERKSGLGEKGFSPEKVQEGRITEMSADALAKAIEGKAPEEQLRILKAYNSSKDEKIPMKDQIARRIEAGEPVNPTVASAYGFDFGDIPIENIEKQRQTWSKMIADITKARDKGEDMARLLLYVLKPEAASAIPEEKKSDYRTLIEYAENQLVFWDKLYAKKTGQISTNMGLGPMPSTAYKEQPTGESTQKKQIKYQYQGGDIIRQ